MDGQRANHASQIDFINKVLSNNGNFGGFGSVIFLNERGRNAWHGTYQKAVGNVLNECRILFGKRVTSKECFERQCF